MLTETMFSRTALVSTRSCTTGFIFFKYYFIVLGNGNW